MWTEIPVIMKKSLLLIVAFTALYVMQLPSAEGQILFNYALGGGSFTPSNAVVRTVNDQKVIASYYDGANYCLACVDPINITTAKLDDHHEIADIRILDNDVFFCGYDRNSKEAFLGHATISDIESQAPHIQLLNFYVQPSLITRLWRLAAYTDYGGTIHLVAIGETWYSNTDVPPYAYPCYSYTSCDAQIIVEYTYQSGVFNYEGNLILHDVYPYYEFPCDVVVTDHYVAVVSFSAADELIIHRCSKNNVLGTFDNFFYYKVPTLKAAFYGCKMKGDTIAVASVFNDGSGTDNMQVRVVDLASMNMPYAQTFDLLDKDDIYEMAYLPDIQRLVLLTNHTYTTLTLLVHTFCFLKPYETVFPYNMEKIYDTNHLSFTSLDRLSTNHIVAAGGDYWMMKDVSYNSLASTCYVIENQPVKELAMSMPLIRGHLFESTTILDYSVPCNETYLWNLMTAPCTY